MERRNVCVRGEDRKKGRRGNRNPDEADLIVLIRADC